MTCSEASDPTLGRPCCPLLCFSVSVFTFEEASMSICSTPSGPSFPAFWQFFLASLASSRPHAAWALGMTIPCKAAMTAIMQAHTLTLWTIGRPAVQQRSMAKRIALWAQLGDLRGASGLLLHLLAQLQEYLGLRTSKVCSHHPQSSPCHFW